MSDTPASGRLSVVIQEAFRIDEERQEAIRHSMKVFLARLDRVPEIGIDDEDISLAMHYIAAGLPMEPDLYKAVEEKLTPNHILVLDKPPEECWICGDPTRWIEVNFETRMCPGPCADEAWGRYWAALHGVVLG